MQFHRPAWLLPTFLLLSLAACAPRPEMDSTLVITGSSTIAPMIADMASLYETQQAATRVDVQTGGSSRGLADVPKHLADIGMVSRPPRHDEIDVAWHPIALDGIGMIVHAENPLRSIDNDTVRAIYTGAIREWSALGGPASPITVVHKAEGRATLDLFLAYTGLKNTEIEPHLVIGDNEHAIKSVLGDPHAIAYVSIGTAEHAASSGRPIRLLPIDGVPATTASLRKGNYPMARHLYLITRRDPDESVRAFLAFARSAPAHPIIEEHFFVPPAK